MKKVVGKFSPHDLLDANIRCRRALRGVCLHTMSQTKGGEDTIKPKNSFFAHQLRVHVESHILACTSRFSNFLFYSRAYVTIGSRFHCFWHPLLYLYLLICRIRFFFLARTIDQ